ncbi:MAG: aromatic acid exporter family protein [Actinomycetes bacterium]
MKRLFTAALKPFMDRKIWLRQITVAAIASATAWFIGNALLHNGAVVAAIVCSLTIRISLHKSVREGFGQIVGTAIGAIIALITVHLFHFGVISIATTMVLCAVIARGLRLDEVASINVPVTALIVMGPGISESTATSRLLSTLIGASVGIVFSFFSHPSTPAGRTIEQISGIGRKTAKLLSDMSNGVRINYTQQEAGKWLSRGRILIELIPSIRSQADEATSYAKWSPLAPMDEAKLLALRAKAMEHTVVQVRGISRALFDASVDGALPEDIRTEISVALKAASQAVTSKIDSVREKYQFVDVTVADHLRIQAKTLSNSLIDHKDQIAHEQMLHCMAIASNIKIISDSLDESSAALGDIDPEEK